jgi:predicted O-methyltransferase YrrM
MKNRIELAEYFNKLGFTKGAEVGVYKGEYAQILCEKIPDLYLIMVDSWIRQQRRIDAKAEAIERTKNYDVRIVQETSLEAAKDVPDGSLDFVFIDAGHTYAEVKEDIEAWAPKVKDGGIVSGHDYYEFPSGKGGVIPAVDEYVAKHGYKLNVIPWDKSQTTDNRQPCWWFEK